MQPNARRAIQAALPTPILSSPIPPPIDPGVFRSVTSIRRLIDEASDLAVRAASGLSSTALGSLPRPGHSSPWATAQSLGMNSTGDQGGGRTVNMSSTRTHRLRVLAVQKLAAAYKADEIAASVMVMQGASSLDDLAERVLRVGKCRRIRLSGARSDPATQTQMISMHVMYISSMRRSHLGIFYSASERYPA